MRKNLVRLASVSLWLALCSQVAFGQATTGTIFGIVKDLTGAVVPGVAITVRNVETGISRSVTTDAEGRYRIPNLGVGPYEGEGALTGFQTAVRRGLELTVGREGAGGLGVAG